MQSLYVFRGIEYEDFAHVPARQLVDQVRNVVIGFRSRTALLGFRSRHGVERRTRFGVHDVSTTPHTGHCTHTIAKPLGRSAGAM
jgi:hypothetical protein